MKLSKAAAGDTLWESVIHRKRKNMKKIVIVGAGPAGLSAAIAASENGGRVRLLEQADRPGRKLLATGGGRCNLSNRLGVEELTRAFGRARCFLRPAFHGFPPEAMRDWFERNGVPLELTDGFHYFPRSGRAGDVLEALLRAMHRNGAELVTGERVRQLHRRRGRIAGVVTETGLIEADRVILTTGGLGYPQLGAGGAGYRLAEAAGHVIIPPCPAMVGLRTQESWPGECAGIALPDCEVAIDLPGEKKHRCRGELLFTHHGISAFAVLDLSGRVSELLASLPVVPLSCNLFAGRTAPQWLAEFADWQRRAGKRSVARLLSEYLPQKLAERLWDDRTVTAANFSAAGRKRLARQLTALRLHAIATDGWEKAMVTRGGVDLAGVEPATLASRLMPGLFFAGEILDVDGPCGGYNLTWAFASGRLAGRAATFETDDGAKSSPFPS